LKLIRRDDPGWMSLPPYLPGTCHVVASAIVVIAFVALVALDKARLALGTGARHET
jgi:hypothetical protein